MSQVSLRAAVLAARYASRVPEPREPPPPPDWLIVASPPEQHDDHVLSFRLAKQPARFEAIRKAVCIQFGITKLEIMSHRRAQRIARARQVCMYLAKNLTPCSFPEIGRRAGGFDHTTVLHAVGRIAELRATKPALDEAITAIESKLQQGEDRNV